MLASELAELDGASVLVELKEEGEERLKRFYGRKGLGTLFPKIDGWWSFPARQFVEIFAEAGSGPLFEVQALVVFVGDAAGDGQPHWIFHCSRCGHLLLVAKLSPRFDFFGDPNPNAFPQKRYYLPCERLGCRAKSYIFPDGFEPEPPAGTSHPEASPPKKTRRAGRSRRNPRQPA